MPDGADGAEENHRRVRRAVWANLFSGGSGCEFYFGYKYPHNDLSLEDFRSRAEAWRWAGVAREFAEQVGLARFEPALNLVDDPDVFVMTAAAHPYDSDWATFYPRGRLPDWADGGRDGAFAVPYDDLTGSPPGEGGSGRLLVYLPAGAGRGAAYPGAAGVAAVPAAGPPAGRCGGSTRWPAGIGKRGRWRKSPPGPPPPSAPPPAATARGDWVVLIGG